MINKLAVHYKAESGSVPKLEAAAIEAAQKLWPQIAREANARARVLTLVEGAAAQTPHVVRQGYSPTALRVAVEFGHEEARLAGLIELARTMLAHLAALADAQNSCALAGRQYVFSPGENTHTSRVYMGRALETTYEDFHDHWLNKHGWLVKPGVDARNGAYRQFHADPKASFFAARAAGVGRCEFEGCAEGHQPDVETYLRAMGNVREVVLVDEKRFMSAADTEVGFYRVVLNLKE